MNENDPTPIDPVVVPETVSTAPVVAVEPVVEAIQETVIAPEAIKTAYQEFQVFQPMKEGTLDEETVIAIPTTDRNTIRKAIDSFPNIQVKDTVAGKYWIDTLESTAWSVPALGMMNDAVNRPTATFKQAIPSERGPIATSAPRLDDVVGTKVTGEAAVLRVKSILGLGSVTQVPLWHSGFWISIKAPSEATLLELDRRLSDEKITLGRQTHGLLFANTSVFYAGALMDTALMHIYETSLAPALEANIREHISILDVPIIVWAMARSIWPRGFPHVRPVLDQSVEQNQVIKERLDIGKLLWVDHSTLTPWQISHMGNRFGQRMTADVLKRYHNEFTIGKGRTVDIADHCSMTFKVPSLDEYLNAGQKWVNNIVHMVDQAFTVDDRPDARDSYILQQGRATNMRQYIHWVESIDAAGALIDDTATLEQTIDALCGEDHIRDTYFTTVRKFIEDSTMAIIAVPATEGETNTVLPRFVNLIPLDPMTTFFILLRQKANQISNR